MATPTNRTFKTIVLAPGESFTLPPDGELTFASNAAGLTSDCAIPPMEDYVCKRFRWALNDDSTPSPALEHQDSRIYSITISDVEYVLDIDTHAIFNNNGGTANSTAANAAVQAAFEAVMPDGIFVIDHCGHDQTGSRLMQDLHFYTFPSLVSGMTMKITGPDFDDGLYLKPGEGTCNTISL